MSDDPEQKARDSAVEHMAAMLGQLATNKRKVYEDVRVGDVDYEASLPRSQYVDDGALFDVHNLPDDTVVGDCEPSVWAGIEDRNRIAAKFAASSQAFANAQSRAYRVLDRVM